MEEIFNVSFRDIENMPEGQDKCAALAMVGLLTDGSYHKQWCLEEIIKAAGYDINEVRTFMQSIDYDWDEGIAP